MSSASSARKINSLMVVNSLVEEPVHSTHDLRAAELSAWETNHEIRQYRRILLVICWCVAFSNSATAYLTFLC